MPDSGFAVRTPAHRGQPQHKAMEGDADRGLVVGQGASGTRPGHPGHGRPMRWRPAWISGRRRPALSRYGAVTIYGGGAWMGQCCHWRSAMSAASRHRLHSDRDSATLLAILTGGATRGLPPETPGGQARPARRLFRSKIVRGPKIPIENHECGMAQVCKQHQCRQNLSAGEICRGSVMGVKIGLSTSAGTMRDDLPAANREGIGGLSPVPRRRSRPVHDKRRFLIGTTVTAGDTAATDGSAGGPNRVDSTAVRDRNQATGARGGTRERGIDRHDSGIANPIHARTSGQGHHPGGSATGGAVPGDDSGCRPIPTGRRQSPHRPAQETMTQDMIHATVEQTC